MTRDEFNKRAVEAQTLINTALKAVLSLTDDVIDDRTITQEAGEQVVKELSEVRFNLDSAYSQIGDIGSDRRFFTIQWNKPAPA